MAQTKKMLARLVLALFFVVFPFGKLVSFQIGLLGYRAAINALDLVVAAGLMMSLRVSPPKLDLVSGVKNFLLILAFSLIFSLSLFPVTVVIKGGWYFLRLAVYLSWFKFVFVNAQKNARLMYQSLILVVIFVALFGWWQYFLYPDLRPFVVWGWDDHLYRLTGTFFDPGFTSIILVLGALTVLGTKAFKNTLTKTTIFAFLLVTLAFTYSRAGYLAFVAGLFLLTLKRGKARPMLLAVAGLIVLVMLLPRPSSEGVKLERLHSVYDRFGNYSETYQVWKSSPVFGVGYNNLCASRLSFFRNEAAESHSCSGADSSILLVLAVSGVVGLLMAVRVGWDLIKTRMIESYRATIYACLLAVLIHSQLHNSLFYPWVLGYLVTMLAVSVVDYRQ